MLQQFRVRKILLIKTALQGSHREAKRGCGVFNFLVSRQHLRPGHFQQRPPEFHGRIAVFRSGHRQIRHFNDGSAEQSWLKCDGKVRAAEPDVYITKQRRFA